MSTMTPFSIVSVEEKRVSHPPLPYDVLSAYQGPGGPLYLGYSDDDRRTHVAADDGPETNVPWGPGRSYLDDGAYAEAAAGLPVTGRLAGSVMLELYGFRRWRRRVTLESGDRRWWVEAPRLGSGTRIMTTPDSAVLAELRGRDGGTIDDSSGQEDAIAVVLFWAALGVMVRKAVAPQIGGSPGPY